MIRTFLFDMGNVLVHFSHERMCAQMGGVCDSTADEVRELLFESNLQYDFERGHISDGEFHRRFEDTVGHSIDFDDLRHAGSDIFELNDSIVPVLNILKSRGHRLVLLSNTSSAHFEFVQRRFNVLQKFDDFVNSFEVGAVKPEAAIFEAALHAIGCEPHECFYTDDIAEYVETGRSYGLQAEVFTDTASLIEQLERRGIDFAA